MIFTLRQSYWALLFAFSSLFVLGLADNIRGPLFPDVLSFFHLSSGVGSLSFATTSSAAFFGSAFTVYLLKKISMAQLLHLAILCMGVGMLVMGQASDFSIFLAGSFLLGTSIGFMGVAQNLLVSESVVEQDRPRALAGLHSMYGLSSFIAPILASAFAPALESWRWPFLVIAGICAVYVIFQGGVSSEPRYPVLSNEQTPMEKAGHPGRVPFMTLFAVGGIFAFYVVAEIMIGTRLAQYMRNYFAMNLEESSRYVTYFFLFMLAGRAVYAFKTFSMSLRRQMNISLVLSLVLLMLGLKIHPVILTFVGLSMAPFYPLSIAYISGLSRLKGRQFLTFAMGFQSLAVVSMHLGVGYLTDAFGLFYAFGVGVLALLLSLFCLNFHPQILVPPE